MAYETARGRVAVRAADAALRQTLGEGLPAAWTPTEGERLPQGLGIRRADAESTLHWLYWGRCPAVRTRDADRLITALEHHLSVPAAAADDQLLLRASAGVTNDGDAVLLPRIGPDIARFDRRLRADGVALVDMPFVVVDPFAAELVVEAPAVTLASPARDTLLDVLGTTKAEPTVPPGRYPLASWLVDGDPVAVDEGPAVVHLLSALAAPTTLRGAAGANRLVNRLRTVVVTMRDVATVLDALRMGPLGPR